MKKTVFIFLLVFILVLLAGCSNKNDADSSSNKGTYRQVDAKTALQALVDMGYTNIVEFGGIKSWPYETE